MKVKSEVFLSYQITPMHETLDDIFPDILQLDRALSIFQYARFGEDFGEIFGVQGQECESAGNLMDACVAGDGKGYDGRLESLHVGFSDEAHLEV